MTLQIDKSQYWEFLTSDSILLVVKFIEIFKIIFSLESLQSFSLPFVPLIFAMDFEIVCPSTKIEPTIKKGCIA